MEDQSREVEKQQDLIHGVENPSGCKWRIDNRREGGESSAAAMEAGRQPRESRSHAVTRGQTWEMFGS